MTTPIDNWFARVNKESIIREYTNPAALTWQDIAYDWTSTINEKIDSNLAIIEDWITIHEARVDNPHSVTKSQVWLWNVDNTSDTNKPVSTATQNALNLKANDNSVVHTTWDENVAWIKTFASSPIVPTPTTNFQASTKKYVDDTVIAIGAWDMAKWIYDTNNDGKVDTSNDVSNSPIITRSTLASSWGLLINIDSATGDIATVWATYIEDERYGFYFNNTANAVSAEFDTAVTRTWSKTLKASTTNATWRFRISQYTIAWWKWYIPLKVSTKYKFWVWIKSNNTTWLTWNLFSAPDQANFWTLTQRASLSLSVWTTDWTYYTTTFTSHATDTIYAPQFRCETAGNISDVWLDINSMTLEEVVEPVANSLTSSSPSLVSFTAVGSTDNIDQSQLWVSTNVWLDTPARFWAQQFTPTKSKLTWVVFQKHTTTGTPTWDIIFRIATDSWSDNPTTTILASYTMPSATYNALSVWVDFTINLPCNLTAWTKYWILFNYSIASLTDFPLLKAATPATAYTGGIYKYWSDGVTYWTTFAGDLYFKTLYYKPTTNFKASQNNSTVSISADEDGFLEASKIDLTTWQFTFDIRNVTAVTWTKFWHIFSSTTETWVAWNTFIFSTPEYQLKSWGTTYVEWIMKINIPWWITDTVISAYLRRAWASYSTDWVSYTTMYNNTWSSTPYSLSYTVTWNVTVLYIKVFSQNWWWVWCYFADSTHPFSIVWTVDVSSYSTLRNYPTNKDVMSQYSTTLGSPTTSATYRATKWGFPSLEYSATEYQYLDIDTTATWSTVYLSPDGTTYTLVADGWSIVLSSTTNPLVYVRSNITANRIYISSNDYNASWDKDWSNKQSVIYQVKSQGILYDIEELKKEDENINERINWLSSWDFLADWTIPMTWDLNLNSNDINNINSIVLDTTPIVSPTEWTLYWDSNVKNLQVRTWYDSVTTDLGREMHKLCRNNTWSTITNGKVVYINWVSTNPTIALAQANDFSKTAKTLWVTTMDIPNGSDWLVTIIGEVHDLNTSWFAAGDILYLDSSVAGWIVNTNPTGINHTRIIWRCIVSNATTWIISVEIWPLSSHPSDEFKITDATDMTKQMTFNVSWVSVWTKRVFTVPNQDVSLVGDISSQTLTNKNISLWTNTITTTKAQLDTAVTDGNIVYVGDTATTTNALQSATTTVNVSSATAPTNWQVLTATSGTAATWQTLPSSGIQTIGMSATNTTMVKTDTVENTIFTQSITGGLLSTTKAIRVRIAWNWVCNSAWTPVVNMRVKYWTTNFVVLSISSNATTQDYGFEIEAIIKNSTATSQSGVWNFTSAKNVLTLAGDNQASKYQTVAVAWTENSANTLDLKLTTQLSGTVGAPDVHFRYYTIELL